MLRILDWLARGSSNSLVQATHAQFYRNPDYLTQDWDVLKTLWTTVSENPLLQEERGKLAMMVMKFSLKTAIITMMMMMAVVGGDGSSGG